MIMLPPIEPALAASNPKFDVLYRDLCTHKLNVDGTSVVGGKARKERETLHAVYMSLLVDAIHG
jgi:hypothetical protein